MLNRQYAEQIAREWNVKDDFSGHVGYVLEFEIQADFMKKYPVHNVGGEIHNELWIPAEELDDFNNHIVDKIRVVNKFTEDKQINP
ncbi:MAG: hypothetical protein KF746_04190 [Chitinophagaceae bacterium]|nr:hypothetical protein [Chitinophagaceae bacterium]